jgi:hypothetical protein
MSNNLSSVPISSELCDKILHRTAVIGVIGLGYVGLPFAVALVC